MLHVGWRKSLEGETFFLAHAPCVKEKYMKSNKLLCQTKAHSKLLLHRVLRRKHTTNYYIVVCQTQKHREAQRLHLYVNKIFCLRGMARKTLQCGMKTHGELSVHCVPKKAHIELVFHRVPDKKTQGELWSTR
jgi:hypothetical protein